MKFSKIPPDPKELPRVGLIGPVVIPALLVLLGWLAGANGHKWSPHTDGLLMMAAFVISTLIGIVASIVTLSKVLPALKQYPSLRSSVNLLCTGISLAFVAAALGFFSYIAINIAVS